MIPETTLSTETRHHAWRIMKILTAEFGHYTIRAVAQLAHDGNRKNITAWTDWLTAEDVVRRREKGCYAVVVAGECPPPGRPLAGRFGRVQHQMWRAMRSLRAFGVADLVEAAGTEEQAVSREAGLAYCTALAQAGLLAATTRGGWRLRPGADSGPRAPVLGGTRERVFCVFDLNTGRWIDLPNDRAVNVTNSASAVDAARAVDAGRVA